MPSHVDMKVREKAKICANPKSLCVLQSVDGPASEWGAASPYPDPCLVLKRMLFIDWPGNRIGGFGLHVRPMLPLSRRILERWADKVRRDEEEVPGR